MKFCYREEDNGITILRCFGYDARIEIPEYIGGKPVTKLAPYTFSARKRKEEDGQYYEMASSQEEAPMLCGDAVEEVVIPKTVLELGDYLFYGCSKLRKIRATQGILRTGRGVFTGCKPSHVEMEFFEGTNSCLKDMIGDIRFRLEVVLWMNNEKTKLIFPEYYEEAVENTPARIVENHFHGSGYKYRQCIFKKGIDFEGYDQLLREAVAWEEEMVVIDLAYCRLVYPFQLEDEAKAAYVSYLKMHTESLITYILDQENVDELRKLCQAEIWEKDTIDQAILEASKRDKREVLSLLMDEKNKRFGQTKKTFEL